MRRKDVLSRLPCARINWRCELQPHKHHSLRSFSNTAPAAQSPAKPSVPALPRYTRLRSKLLTPSLHSPPGLFRGDQFHNPWPSFQEKTLGERLSDLGRWLTSSHPNPLVPKDYPTPFPPPYDTIEGRLDLDQHLPVVMPNYAAWQDAAASVSPASSITYTWIGHATCLVQLGSLTILTDPFFSQRASAWQRLGPKRIRPPPSSIEQLPPIDIILISHNHFDHLDLPSIKQLKRKLKQQLQQTGRRCKWFVPLRAKRILLGGGLHSNDVMEMDWWDRGINPSPSPAPGSTYTVTCVGAQHWSSRWALIDNRSTLWAGFIVHHHDSGSGGEPLSYYFSGDTGYCGVFREIGAVLGPVDVSSIGIGAYSPRWLLSGAHVCPSESVQIHRDVKSRLSFGIHWGTIVLSDEMVMSPKIELQEALKQQGIEQSQFQTTKHGETIIIPRKQGTTSSSSSPGEPPPMQRSV